jgi:hypothetical protein
LNAARFAVPNVATTIRPNDQLCPRPSNAAQAAVANFTLACTAQFV